MKRFTKIMLVSGVTLVLAAGAIVNYLLAQPAEQVSDLTLANIEAMALPPELMDNDLSGGLFWGTCAYACPGWCSVTCPRCKQVTYVASPGCGTITGGFCGNCFYIP